MHFFNPVKKMPLVEIVRGEETSDATITRTAALAVALGKTPVVTKDVPGFLVNRLLGPYLDEAVRLFVDGVSPVRIDRLLVAFGMPMGPFTLLDEVGFDIAAHAAGSLHEGYGARMTPCDALGGMISPDRLGKKSGKGFYDHTAKRKKGQSPPVMGDLHRFQRSTRAMLMSDRDIVDRIVLAMVGEGARAFEERVVATAAEFDLATVFGTGFAPFRGGLLKYVDLGGGRQHLRAHGRPSRHGGRGRARRRRPALSRRTSSGGWPRRGAPSTASRTRPPDPVQPLGWRHGSRRAPPRPRLRPGGREDDRPPPGLHDAGICFEPLCRAWSGRRS